jgi:hypothetical protein
MLSLLLLVLGLAQEVPAPSVFKPGTFEYYWQLNQLQDMGPEDLWGWCDERGNCCTTNNPCRAKGCTGKTPVCCPKGKILRYDFARMSYVCVKVPFIQ